MPEHIGRFEILEKIGEGGMGELFKERDLHMNRIDGALKRQPRDRLKFSGNGCAVFADAGELCPAS